VEDGSDFKSVIIIMEAIAEALSGGAVYYAVQGGSNF